MPFDRELAVALDAARLAGAFVLREYETFVPIPDAPVTISTHVDRGSQEIILRHLRDQFPADGLCAEEATDLRDAVAGAGGRVWVVDPIDGTRGFARKTGEFSVMIGLTVDRETVVGVVLEPVQDRWTYAAKGDGCWTRTGNAAPTRCRVSERSSLADAVLVRSHPKPGSPPAPAVAALNPARTIETYSAGVKLAVVARGEGDIYLNSYERFHDWDISAGHILVEEAGGTVTTLRGVAVRYGRENFAQLGGLLATNGRVHAEAVKRIKEVVS